MAWWEDIGSLSRAAVDWLNRTGEAIVPGSTPPGAPGYAGPPASTGAVPPGDFVTGTRRPGQQPNEGPHPAAPEDAAAAAKAAKEAADAADAALSTLDRFNKQRRDVENAIIAAETASNDDPESEKGLNAAKALPGLRALLTNITSQVAAEENRLRDEKLAKEKEEREKKDKPENGQTRTVPWEEKLPNGQTLRGIKTEVYKNGIWDYVTGSSKAEPGATPEGMARVTNQVLTDGAGAYWTYDQATGKATAINGPAAAVKTITDPDGSVWTQQPDGTKGQKLFDSLPQTVQTTDGRLLGYDKRTGQQVFAVDTQTPEGRALAERLQRATVEAAELGTQPKFGSAVAQYQSEASRRQQLARTELSRLQDLQKSGQISPDQAEAQFDRWMQLNVEGPLAGYKSAAEEERRTLEQEHLTRQTAEANRVEALNRQRDTLAYQAGEEGRQEAITLGQATRAPEYIRDLGGLASSLSQGKTNFQFSPESFDVANYRKAVPNVNELADAAVNRLLSRVQPATARDVNVPLPALPAGPELRSMMDQVKYSGPLSAVPQGEAPLEGQGAVDLGGGRARTVFANGRYVDWPIPQG